jgi:hypothetical protein
LQTEQELSDRRTLSLFLSPSDPNTSLFVAYTPVRDDFASLGSFGSCEAVGEMTILPKGEVGGTEVRSKMLEAGNYKGAYLYEGRARAFKDGGGGGGAA